MYTKNLCQLALFALVLFLAVSQSVYANQTAWTEIAPGAKMRLISTNKLSADNEVTAAIEMQLAPGWKTYWRIPGETGIPMVANWNGSQNVGATTFHWPMPKRSLAYGVMDYVYEGDVTIPLTVQLDSPNELAQLAGQINLGVCSDICVPVLWKGALEIDTEKPAAGHAFRLMSASANVPKADERPNAPFEKVGYDKLSDKLVFQPANDPLSNSSLIFDLPKSSLLFDMPHSRPESGTMTIAALSRFDLSSLVGKHVRLTYDSQDGPFTKLVAVKAVRIVDGELNFN
ncbi:protein-disulfide reductase DsbD domain-containing protein [Maritalea sp.]|uniref:protein-disulfide reductase DsbD domain-containing protein n=1 Tax=Maritalea sp. TaxID=2003361 RepID=UPI003EF8141C